jgi:hypothetical protein
MKARFALRETGIAIEMRGDFSDRARYREKQTEQPREQKEKPLTGTPNDWPDGFHAIRFRPAGMNPGRLNICLEQIYGP